VSTQGREEVQEWKSEEKSSAQRSQRIAEFIEKARQDARVEILRFAQDDNADMWD
jgi:hypothetical protein